MNIRGKKILVTGGMGFLGRAISRELIERGGEVQPLRSQYGDLRDPDVARRLIANVDAVVHLAANVGGIGYNMEHPVALFEDNILMGINILRACHAAGIEKVLLAGTVCVYSDGIHLTRKPRRGVGF